METAHLLTTGFPAPPDSQSRQVRARVVPHDPPVLPLHNDVPHGLPSSIAQRRERGLPQQPACLDGSGTVGTFGS